MRDSAASRTRSSPALYREGSKAGTSHLRHSVAAKGGAGLPSSPIFRTTLVFHPPGRYPLFKTQYTTPMPWRAKMTPQMEKAHLQAKKV